MNLRERAEASDHRATELAQALSVLMETSKAAVAEACAVQSDELVALEHLSKLTFAIQHNPNCPSPWLVRVPGRSAIIDMKPYGAFGGGGNLTDDQLGFGKTLAEAVAVLIPSEEKA